MVSDYLKSQAVKIMQIQDSGQLFCMQVWIGLINVKSGIDQPWQVAPHNRKQIN